MDGFWIDETAGDRRPVSPVRQGHRLRAPWPSGRSTRPTIPLPTRPCWCRARWCSPRPAGPADLSDWQNWWRYVPGANWAHPGGRGRHRRSRATRSPTCAGRTSTAYAAWAGKQLPTEAEWEFAARGGLDGALYAWGDEFAPARPADGQQLDRRVPLAEPQAGGRQRTIPVRSFPANGYGLYDMAGNVWEWTADFYRADHAGPPATRAARPGQPAGRPTPRAATAR